MHRTAGRGAQDSRTRPPTAAPARRPLCPKPSVLPFPSLPARPTRPHAPCRCLGPAAARSPRTSRARRRRPPEAAAERWLGAPGAGRKPPAAAAPSWQRSAGGCGTAAERGAGRRHGGTRRGALPLGSSVRGGSRLTRKLELRF